MLRQVIHELESLNQIGPEALPVIRASMARNEDLDRTVSTAVAEDQADNDENAGRGALGRGRSQDNLFSALSSCRAGAFGGRGGR